MKDYEELLELTRVELNPFRARYGDVFDVRAISFRSLDGLGWVSRNSAKRIHLSAGKLRSGEPLSQRKLITFTMDKNN